MRKLWLASSSPRRRLLLENSGFLPQCVSSDLDDDLLRISNDSVLATCAARAWFKAESVHDLILEMAYKVFVIVRLEGMGRGSWVVRKGRAHF